MSPLVKRIPLSNAVPISSLAFLACLLTVLAALSGCWSNKNHEKLPSTAFGSLTDVVVSKDQGQILTTGSVGVTFEWVYQPDGSTSFEAGVTKGTITLTACDDKDITTHNIAGFSLAEGMVVHIQRADIYFANNADFPRTFWANNGNGGIRDMGNIPLENVANAPLKSVGQGVSQYHNEQPLEVVEGHTYCVVTRDAAHYAKIHVIDVSP